MPALQTSSNGTRNIHARTAFAIAKHATNAKSTATTASVDYEVGIQGSHIQAGQPFPLRLSGDIRNPGGGNRDRFESARQGWVGSSGYFSYCDGRFHAYGRDFAKAALRLTARTAFDRQRVWVGRTTAALSKDVRTLYGARCSVIESLNIKFGEI